MPESTVELLKRAVESQAKTINKPVGDRREPDENTEPPKKRRGSEWG